MRMGVTFISVALTGFALTTLAGVVYAYNNGLTASSLLNQPTSLRKAVSLPLMAATKASTAFPTQSSLGPRDAATLAAKFLNRTDLYSVDLSIYNGNQAYKVVFVSGDVAYVSFAGQVLKVVLATPTAPPPVVIINTPSGKRGGETPAPPTPSAPPPPPGEGGDGSGG